MKKQQFIDMNTGKPLESGHIVAVRYVWNSYVGEVSIYKPAKSYLLHSTGAQKHAFNTLHTLKATHTYQILSHREKDHPDYNERVNRWYFKGDVQCPIVITVYDNQEVAK